MRPLMDGWNRLLALQITNKFLKKWRRWIAAEIYLIYLLTSLELWTKKKKLAAVTFYWLRQMSSCHRRRWWLLAAAAAAGDVMPTRTFWICWR